MADAMKMNRQGCLCDMPCLLFIGIMTEKKESAFGHSLLFDDFLQNK